MISERTAKMYCCEDISLIENYHTAIADKERMWYIHHRRECDDEGRTLFTHKQLIEMNLYYKRPAEELIFVTRFMHSKIHREMHEKCGNNVGKKYGKITGKKYGAINGKKNSIPILQFAKDGTFIKEWSSINETGRQLGIGPQHICACCQDKSKTAGGFMWRYKDSK